MKEDLLKQLLESVLGKSKSARGGEEAVFTCPSCNHHKKKLTLNLSTQKFQCWVCGYKGHNYQSTVGFLAFTPRSNAYNVFFSDNVETRITLFKSKRNHTSRRS